MTKAEIEKPHVGWTMDKRNTLATIILYSRSALVLLLLFGHIWITYPPVAITAKSTLPVNNSIGICQHNDAFQLLFKCTPQYMRFAESKGAHTLSVYDGLVKSYDTSLKPTWTKRISSGKVSSDAVLTVKSSGAMEIQSNNEVIWSSKDEPCGVVEKATIVSPLWSPLADFIDFVSAPQETRLIMNRATAGTPIIECSSSSPNHISKGLAQ